MSDGDFVECGRPAIYKIPLGGQAIYICGLHSEVFEDWELDLYEGDETCLAAILEDEK